MEDAHWHDWKHGPRHMANMSIKRPATWLLAFAALVWLAGSAWAQPPANSNLEYQAPTMSYENGSPQFAESQPESPSLFGKLLPGPLGFEPAWRWFGPAETSSYGNGPRPHIGFFVSYERVFWALSRPTTSVIGSTTAAGPDTSGALVSIPPPFGTGTPFPAINSADTGFLLANGAWGNRIELGYIDTDNYGWLVSALDHISQGQYRTEHQVEMQFDDPGHLLDGFGTLTVGGINFVVDFGKMATVFDLFQVKNIATLNGVELMRMYRAPRLHHGGYFDFLYGLRWVQLTDTFTVAAWNTSQQNPNVSTTDQQNINTGQINSTFINPLSDSFWATRAQNNIFGPQIGFRWANQRGHWITSIEGRFMAGTNFQSVHQTTNLGTQVVNNIALFGGTAGTTVNTATILPLSFQGLGTNTHASAYTFSPVGELRVQGVYAFTSTVGLKIGYTALFLDNITRASNRVDYSSPNLIGITTGGIHQIFWAQGINVGLEFNR